MTIMELVRSAKDFITGEPPKHRSTRQSFRAEETDAELMAALAAADYSHLPELHSSAK
jgi:hypothetical protein